MEDFNSKYTGEEVENILDSVGGKQDAITDLDAIRSGAEKGATALQEETYKGTVTGVKVNGETKSPSDGVVDLGSVGTYSKPSTGIPNSDLSEEVREKLETAHRNAMAYQGTVTNIKINGVTKSADNGVIDLGNLGTYSKPSTGIPKSDLNPSVQTSLGKADTALQAGDLKDEVYIADFTMESLREGMNNGSHVNCDIQALVTAMNANKIILVRDGADSSYKGVYVLNGYAEDLLYFSIVDTAGNVLYCDGTDYVYVKSFINGQTLFYRSWDDKQDQLQSGENIKTINGESIVGSGDITIEGGVGTITGVSVNGTSIATSGVADIPAASTSKYGVTKLTTLTNSSSTTLAATASAVKAVYDLANSKQGRLESGTNIKTINGASILGSGDITISGGSSGGKEVVKISNGVIELLERNKIYIVEDRSLSRTFEIQAIEELMWGDDYAEYIVIFSSEDDMHTGKPLSITLPDNVYWANGQIPDLTLNANYELSIVGWEGANNAGFNAVITPFKTL